MLNPNTKSSKKRKINNGTSNGDSKPVDPVAKKQKLKKDLMKVAKVDEINQLQATEKLYHSNFFHMQIEELLKETKLPEKRQRVIDTFYEQLVQFLTSLPSEEEETKAVHELKWLKKSRVVPPCSQELRFDSTPIQFRFLSPTSVFAVGSLRTKTVINADPILDVCIEIPADFFTKGNHLNGIYHRKRALYLSYLALKLSGWDQVAECKFTFINSDPLQPALVLVPSAKHGKHIRFQLRTVCGEESFKIEHLSPDKSNVKQLCVAGKNNAKKGASAVMKNTGNASTPHYNSSILGDLNGKFNDEFLFNTIGENQHVRDAIILLKIWLKQREYSNGYGAFSGYILSMFVAYLIEKNLITLTMTSYQIIRQVWIYLTNTSWDELGKSISMYESKFRTTQPEPENFHQHYDVVFIDGTGYYNLCSNLSLDVYRRVKDDSTNALHLLNNEKINSFRYLFGTKMPIYTQADHIIRLNVKEIQRKSITTEESFDYCGYWYPHISKSILKVLRKGLDKRIHAILPITDAGQTWAITETCSSDSHEFRFGLVLNSEYALDILDKGPQSNLPEAEDYRQFWGSKSELRRFQDGSIAEACVWGAVNSSMVEKRLVCKQIVEHLLQHHFDAKETDIRYTAAQLDTAFAVDSIFKDFLEGEKNSENLAIQTIKTFDELAKNLRALDELPLVITSVLGKSPVFRYCELLPIIANARLFTKDNKDTFNAHVINEAVIQFESSGKWPNEIGAIQRVKSAFYLQIAQGLRKKFHLRTRVNLDSVDVIKDGYMYRLSIAVPRELGLYKKEVTSKGITKYRDTAESLRLERELILLPKITVSLHTLYHQHSSFGPTVLLAKRWLYSQLIDSYLFADICTELLVAHQFYNSKAYEPPTQPQTAFIRFLHTLASTNWNTELILLNFNDDLSQTYVEKLETTFISDRSSFPPLTIITSNGETDKHTVWSKKVPSVEILARVTLLARHALKLVQQNILGDFVAAPLFSASLDGYDLIINLNKSHLRDPLVHDFSRTNSLLIRQRRPFIPIADYNPVESYLDELRTAYDHVAVFFYNPCGGEQIAILWKPTSFAKQEFKLSALMGQVQNSPDGELEFDHKKLQEDFAVLGQGLVESIVDNRQKAK